MGCDIHLAVEHQLSDDSDYWFQFMLVKGLPRDYQLFGNLSDGVRGYSGNIPQRGIPRKCSFYIEDGKIGDHSYSWCSPEEFSEALNSLQYEYSKEGYNIGAEWWAVLAACKVLDDKGHKVRLVYGFDS